MANSELAESICTTYFNNTEGTLLRNVIDAEFQEVREALEQLMTRRWFGDKPTVCWCNPRAYPDSDGDADQDTRCQRARALWARLEVK